MKKNYYIHLVALLLIFFRVDADSTITFFFRPQPLTDTEKLSKKLRKPGKIAKYTIRGKAQPALEEGILVTYGGYVVASNHNGEVVLPRKHQKIGVDILITPQIVPVPLFENTILHWTRVPGVPTKVYSCEQKYDDKKEQHYWWTQEITLTEDMVIPLSTIIILAKPKNISMNIGRADTNETANLVLPDVYVKKGINTIENSLYMLTIRHFFRPVEEKENRQPLKIITHVVD
jgi:hypothetical protein